MKQKSYLLITIITFFCLTLTCASQAQEKLNNSISFIQGDSSYTIVESSDSIQLERKPFALRYFGRKYDDKKEKFYAAQIAILDDPNDTIFLKKGQATKNISYFEPGTGMAPGENERYDTIFITNTGHHYLTYENEKEKRIDLISKNQDVLLLEWKIFAAVYDEKTTQFPDLRLTALYFVILIDNNLNDIIDNNELKIIKIVFR